MRESDNERTTRTTGKGRHMIRPPLNTGYVKYDRKEAGNTVLVGELDTFGRLTVPTITIPNDAAEPTTIELRSLFGKVLLKPTRLEFRSEYDGYVVAYKFNSFIWFRPGVAHVQGKLRVVEVTQ